MKTRLPGQYDMLPAVEPEQFFPWDILGGNFKKEHPLSSRFQFRSSYMGESTYDFHHPTLGTLRLRYRYAKEPWRWNKEDDGRRHWNFPDRQSFENQVNSAHGLLLVGCNGPADELTLEAYREACGHPEARTGFYCHLRGRCVPCKPSKTGMQSQASTKTWKRKIAFQIEEIKTLKAEGNIFQALYLADRLPTFLADIKDALIRVLPEWQNTTIMPSLKLAA